MNRYTKLIDALVSKFGAENKHHIEYSFQRGYSDMSDQIWVECETQEVVIGFDWSPMVRLPTEAEKTAYYYGVRIASRVEYLLTVLDEEAVAGQIESIVMQEHHNMLYTPRIEQIPSIVSKDFEALKKVKKYVPSKVHVWLDQAHHPAVIAYTAAMFALKIT